MSAIKGRVWLGPSGAETLFESGWQNLEEEDDEIAREGRVANGDLVCDLIATKKKFTFDYELIEQTTLTTLEGFYALDSLLSLKVERSDDSIDTYVVRMRPLKRKRRWARDVWYWATQLVLEEV